MRGYEEGKPIYFATPPIQLVCSLHASLKEITARPIEERWQKHQQASQDFKKFITDELGLKLVRAIPFKILKLEKSIVFFCRFPTIYRSLPMA